MTNLIYSQMKPHAQKIRFKGIAHDLFLAFTLSFRNFN